MTDGRIRHVDANQNEIRKKRTELKRLRAKLISLMRRYRKAGR